MFKKSKQLQVKVEKNKSAKCTASNVHNLGSVYHQQGKLDKALKQYNKTLHLYSQEYGEEHIQNAKVLFNIGSVYYDKGMLEQALEYYQKSLSIQQKHLNQ